MAGNTERDVGKEDTVNWSVFSCSQNLPAILNDPKRGKQKDFFTKTWGEAFVDTAAVVPSPILEDVPNAYFATYYRKLVKRNKKYRDRKVSAGAATAAVASGVTPKQESVVHTLFPQLGLKDSSQLMKAESNPIPKIYFSQTFALSSSETFREVFAVDTHGLPGKLVQDKLSHYLDMVEVGLAQQISKKSSAFFSAVSTQDKVAEKVTRAIHVVKQIKEDLVEIKKDNVITPLSIIKQSKRQSNLVQLHQKLQLMSTVHQAQRAIQSLLGNSDFVGALDLISTTQDVLRQELQGLVSFRHLDSQLVEIRNAIEKMLRAELERNLSADLNRPVEQMDTFCDRDRLISIVFGHLRLGKVAAIITVLAKEITTAMTTTCKQTLIEAISESDSKSDSLINSNSIFQGIPQLHTDLWVKMVTQLGERLVHLLQHIKDVILLFQNCADIAIGRSSDSSVAGAGAYLPDSEEAIIPEELYQNFTSELSLQLDKTSESADEKFTSMLRHRKTWMIKKEVLTTFKVVHAFVAQLEEFANSLPSGCPKSFRFKSVVEVKVQVTEFIRNFHQKQTDVINSTLDKERWKSVSEERARSLYPTSNIKVLIEKKSRRNSGDGKILHCNNNDDSISSTNGNGNLSQKSVINGHEDPVVTAEVFYLMIETFAEYLYLLTLTGAPEVVLGIVELLRIANTRMANLVLGAGAVELKICKSITVAILVTVFRGLTWVAETICEAKQIFQEHLLSTKSQHVLKQIDAVQQEYCRHAESIENKMVGIIGDVIDAELSSWEAKPPVPSVPINNVSRNIVKFREAIGPILNQAKISSLFLRIDKLFRTKLKERISTLGIKKDGGPRHGVVTSEMMHYAENLRKLSVLPANIISNSCLTNDLWD